MTGLTGKSAAISSRARLAERAYPYAATVLSTRCGAYGGLNRAAHTVQRLRVVGPPYLEVPIRIKETKVIPWAISTAQPGPAMGLALILPVRRYGTILPNAGFPYL